ncbi:MAG: hydantoinase/oxoprolinase family protein [candidate division NC10 bacterium]|nr:hydantoinase/oxoprolinase family protein [candidate division NC10 bacterium]
MMMIGVDVGGTFTDLVFVAGGRLWTQKVLSTHPDPARGVLEGLSHEAAGREEWQLVHGSTVATNALLERKGAKVALITTAGFEDVLEIGRQNRVDLYDFMVERHPVVVPRSLRFGVRERVDCRGKVLEPLDEESLGPLLDRLAKEKVASVAICLLSSYANPSHEARVLHRALELGIPVSASHRILPEYREYERCATTVVNAYVSPLMERYLGRLEAEIGEGRLRIMQSNGGSISAATARQEAVRTILSGPAGGVVGAASVAKHAGFDKTITFDMGGTSTDVSLVDGDLSVTTEATVGGLPLRVPLLDIHTVGSGGGSLVWIDEGGALRVGPQSAGADPGPVCYGRGDQITVTDAHLCLGRLDPDRFLGGKMRLDVERAEAAMNDFARQVKLDPLRLAEGTITVANAAMEKAIRVISVGRGYDPRAFCLVSFGGAGGLHACSLAWSLSIPWVLVPMHAGLLSAYGMLVADVVKDYAKTILRPTTTTSFEEIEAIVSLLKEQGLREMKDEGVAEGLITTEAFVDMRYLGQSYELRVPFGRDFASRFHEVHRRSYGYANPARETESVTLRLRVRGKADKPPLSRVEEGSADAASASVGTRRIFLEDHWVETPVYAREALRAANRIAGPALVVEMSATTLIAPGWEATVDAQGNLLLKNHEPHGASRG